MAPSPRQYSQQLVHFLRKSIVFGNDGTAVTVGAIPANSLIIKPMSGVHVTTAFNGATTNTVDIGTATSTNLWATALSLTATTFAALNQSVAGFLVTSDTIIQAAVTATATSTAGAAIVEIAYLPNIDG